MNTPNLDLPYIMPSQAQKHVTHNEALRALDAVIHIAVETAGLDMPPDEPAEGWRCLVGDSPSGIFAGHAGKLAAFHDGAWAFFVPQPGWTLWEATRAALLVFNGVEWAEVGGGDYLPLQGGALTGTLALPQLELHEDQPLTADDNGLYAAGQRLLTEANRPVGIMRAQQAFIASTTWAKPEGVQRVLAWVWGAGGGGGGAQGGSAGGACGAGGGAGGFGWKWIDVSALESVPITIGAPGAAGDATGGPGGTGGTTSFGTHLSATGGTGGSGQTTGNWGQIVAGGSGGVASNGDFNVIGSPGSPGIRLDEQNGIAGRGAPAAMIGGGGNGFAGNTAGQSGFARGDGGGGGVVATNATGQTGGAGASGMVWLWMFE